MSDNDWEAKYWANRAAQIANNPSPPTNSPLRSSPPPSRDREIDAGEIFSQNRMMQQTHSGRNGGAVSVFLREGFDYYRLVPNPAGFGTTVPLIRHVGKISQVQGKEFVMRQEVRGWCIDASSPAIDLAKMNEQPERMLSLVEVEAPFVGTLLVPREALVEIRSPHNVHGGREVLKG